METKKHDAVFILGDGSFNHENKEIGIAVASLRKYCASWLHNIYIVGENPGLEGVTHVPASDPYSHDKDANIIHKLRVASEMLEVTDDFLFCSDDQLVTCESAWEDFAPRYKCIYEPNTPFWYRLAHNKLVLWDVWLCQTMRRFGPGARFFEPHIWSPMNKEKFLDMCRTYDYAHEHGITCQSLYYNHIGEQGVPKFDHAMVKVPPFVIPEGVRHIGYTDRAFAEMDFRRQLRRIVE